MFRAITETQWKGTRGAALLATFVAFMIPLMALGAARQTSNAFQFVQAIGNWGPGYAMVAAGAGLLVALSAWSPDHRGRHVYALTLPVPRWQYALMRYGAGALFLAAPIAGTLAGTLVVTLSGDIPAGLHAYPLALTARFALAAGVSYSMFFAVSSATAKTAGIVLGSIAAVLLTQYVLGVLSVQYDLMGQVSSFLFYSPGVLSVFSGSWALIDV